MSGARERLFLAERAVLYATRFDFVVEHPVTLLLQALQQPPLPSVLCVGDRLTVVWGHDVSGWFLRPRLCDSMSLLPALLAPQDDVGEGAPHCTQIPATVF